MKLTNNQTIYAEYRISRKVEVLQIVEITDKTILYITSEEVATRRTLQYFYDNYIPVEEIVKPKDDFFEAELFTDKENLQIKLDELIGHIRSIWNGIEKLKEKELEERESEIALSEVMGEEEEKELEIRYTDEGVTKLN